MRLSLTGFGADPQRSEVPPTGVVELLGATVALAPTTDQQVAESGALRAPEGTGRIEPHILIEPSHLKLNDCAPVGLPILDQPLTRRRVSVRAPVNPPLSMPRVRATGRDHAGALLVGARLLADFWQEALIVLGVGILLHLDLDRFLARELRATAATEEARAAESFLRLKTAIRKRFTFLADLSDGEPLLTDKDLDDIDILLSGSREGLDLRVPEDPEEPKDLEEPEDRLPT